LGRFISRDPIWIADDLNLYAYVGNSPVMFTDPTGEKAKDLWKKLLANIALDFIWIWGICSGNFTSSYMLSKFMYWDWSKDYYYNYSPISIRLKYTDFYREQIDSMKSILESTKPWVKITQPLFADAWSVTDNGMLNILLGKYFNKNYTVLNFSETDFWHSFWTIQGTISWIKNDDGSITTNLHIEDSYIYNEKDRNDIEIDNPMNLIALYYQKIWWWTPFIWELNITETFK